MKKECEFFRDKLFDYSIGEIESDMAEKVKLHIEMCIECWKIVDDYKQTDTVISGVLKVDFSGEVWKMERKEILKRATQKTNIKKELTRIFKILFTTKRVLSAAAATLLLIFSITTGLIQHKKSKELEQEKSIIQNIGLYENIEILERLDFYKKIHEKGVKL